MKKKHGEEGETGYVDWLGTRVCYKPLGIRYSDGLITILIE